MKRDRKALFFDIDGTLFSEIWLRVPESAAAALREARACGHLVFINTGRTYCQTNDIREAVEADGYLCGCGTYIRAGEEILYNQVLPVDMRRQIKDGLRCHNLEGVLEGVDFCSITSSAPRNKWLEHLKDFFRNQGALLEHGWEDSSFEFSKFCFVDDGQGDREGFVGSLCSIEVIDRGDGYYECVPEGHTKATAISFILERYGIPLKNAWVFGDSMNDLAMFQIAENAVLMGKHETGLEPYASFVTKTVEEDGIRFALETAGII